MDDSYVIRDYQPKDYDNLIRLVTDTERLRDECYISSKILIENILKRKDNRSEDGLFLAEKSGDIIGCMNAIPELNINRVVFSCIVHSAYRRRGLGTMLLGFAMNYALQSGVKVMHTNVYEDNIVAKEFLTRLGFKSVRSFPILRLNLSDFRLKDKVQESGIRYFKSGEESMLTELQNQSFADTWGYNLNTVEDISSRINLPNYSQRNIIVAHKGSKLIGYCWMRTDPDAKVRLGIRPYIYMLGVDPDYRGEGIGKKLLLEGLRHLKNKGFKIVELTVDGKNETAIGLYHSYGFKVWKTSLWYEKVLD